jgi:hypothetical protein
MKTPTEKTPTTPMNNSRRNISTIRKNSAFPPQTKELAGDGASGTAESKEVSTRAKPTRKIDAVTIAEMAKLCAKMLTETESCRRLGIRPKAWFDLKARSNRVEKFAELLEAFRADRIEQLIDRIEKSAKGEDLKFPDWRAALALLKITDQKRFGDTPVGDLHPPAVLNVNVMLDAVKRVYQQRGVVDVKALPLGAGVAESNSVKTIAAPRGIPTRKKEAHEN